MTVPRGNCVQRLAAGPWMSMTRSARPALCCPGRLGLVRAGGITTAALLIILFAGSASYAGDRYAMIVTGASGGDAYAQKYDQWRATFVSTLREKFGYGADRLRILAETESEGVHKATRANVQRELLELRKRLTRDDQLLILLIGHGTSIDGDDAKFNLVGPDMSASDWAELLKPLPGRLVFVDTTGASFPFLQKLAGRGRVILTATDSAAQQFETVFPEYFVNAFNDAAADTDKDGRVSLWEAFTFASAGVHQWFEQKGQLPTERGLLDDTGAGVGREARNPGPDGQAASVTFLEPDASVAVPANTTIGALQKRRAELEAQIEELKARKATLLPDQYDAELERVLLELARIMQQIRAKS
jgi:hypothetical protein